MKKLSILALALLSIHSANVFAAKQAAGAMSAVSNAAGGTAGQVTDVATGDYVPVTVSHSAPVPVRATANYTCDLIGAQEPDAKLSGSAGVDVVFTCNTTARGMGVGAAHPQGRPKACGAAKDKACVYSGSTLGGKTAALSAQFYTTTTLAATAASCGKGADTDTAAATCP